MITYRCKQGFFIVTEGHKEIQLTSYNERFVRNSFNLTENEQAKIFKAMKRCFTKDKQ